MEKYLSVFLKFLIVGLNRDLCLMPKIIILLKIKICLKKVFLLILLEKGLIKREVGFIHLTILSTALFQSACF